MHPIIDAAPDTRRPTNVMAILNPASIGPEISSVESKIAGHAGEIDFEVRFYHTDLAVSTATVAADAIASGADLIIVAGGDGTIMEVVNAVIGTTVPIGIIPVGTGNLLAINLGIPMQIDEAVTAALGGAPRSIDLVKVNNEDHYFAVMGGLGFDAAVMESTDRDSKQRFGRLAYIWTAVQHLEGELFDAFITLDNGKEMVVQARSILIANMGFLGININAFPTAIPDDGIIQVGILKAASTVEFARLMAETLIGGVPQSDPTFDMLECRTIDISLPVPQQFEYDGEVIGMVDRLRAEVVSKAVHIMTPTGV